MNLLQCFYTDAKSYHILQLYRAHLTNHRNPSRYRILFRRHIVVEPSLLLLFLHLPVYPSEEIADLIGIESRHRVNWEIRVELEEDEVVGRCVCSRVRVNVEGPDRGWRMSREI